ncbi:hypothetical protein VTI74DRAFT_5380 [Chaetomium olivicolor]
MAKVKPVLTLMEMEDDMGYKVDASSRPDDAEKRFYSDLRPVPDDTYGLTEKNYQEFVKRKHDKDSGKIAAGLLPRAGQSDTIGSAENRIILTHENTIGFYRFPVDICYGSGFNLPLLLTEAEAVRTLSVAKLHHGTSPSVNGRFFELPREIRDKIYIFAIPKGKWRITNIDDFEQENFTGGIGDPSGFYYPLSKDMVVLRANKQMRLEALPFAYRRTTFILDDLDDVIKLLVAIGQMQGSMILFLWRCSGLQAVDRLRNHCLDLLPPSYQKLPLHTPANGHFLNVFESMSSSISLTLPDNS